MPGEFRSCIDFRVTSAFVARTLVPMVNEVGFEFSNRLVLGETRETETCVALGAFMELLVFKMCNADCGA